MPLGLTQSCKTSKIKQSHPSQLKMLYALFLLSLMYQYSLLEEPLISSKSRYPNQTLFTSDKKHPNPIGSYLAACVIFSKISGLSSLGLNRRVASKPRKGKTLYYFIVEKKMAENCQRIADEIVFNR